MRIKKMFQGTVPENKILDTTSSSQTDTYSCRKINELVANAGGGGGTNASAETQEIMQIGVTSGFTLSISSAWQLLTVPFTTNKISIGNNLSLTPEGHIKIGPGISKISVRGNILTTSSALGLIDMRIYIIRDGQAINSGATYLGLDKAKSYRTVYIELPILEVQENDEICIKVTSEVSCSLTVADNAYLCVEKINETNVISGGGTGGSGVSIDQIYPVGSIYISASATVDPNVVFTGTQWERFANGKTLIGVDEEDADFATVGLEGGSKDAIVVKHSHSVTGEAASAGAHTHTVKGTSAKTSGSIDGLCETWNDKTQDRNGSTSSNGAHTHTVTGTAGEVGEDGTGKNLQPFITVFMWKRVA